MMAGAAVKQEGMTIATIEEIQEMGARMKAILGLSASPVGVRFLNAEEAVEGAKILDRHRYCQALMRARHGQNVVLDAEGISCPAAARAFGFRPLPEHCAREKAWWDLELFPRRKWLRRCSSRCRIWRRGHRANSPLPSGEGGAIAGSGSG